MLYTLYYAILNIIERLIVVVIFNTDRMTASRAGLSKTRLSQHFELCDIIVKRNRIFFCSKRRECPCVSFDRIAEEEQLNDRNNNTVTDI